MAAILVFTTHDMKSDIISAAYVMRNTVIPKSIINELNTVPSVGNLIPVYSNTISIVMV